MCVVLTRALPERTAGVRVGLDGCAQQVTLRLADVVSAVLRRIVQHQLSAKADVFAALVHTQRIRRLWTENMMEPETSSVTHILIGCLMHVFIHACGL